MSRVVHLTSVHRPFDTRIFLKECRSLHRAGYEVVLVVPHAADEVADGITIRAVSPPSGRLERMVVTARRVVELGLSEEPDVLHVHDPELLPWLRLLRHDGVPTVYDMHEDLGAQVVTKSWVPTPVRRPLRLAAELGLRLLLHDLPVVFAECSYRDSFPWTRRAVVVQNMPLAARLFEIEEPKHEKPTVGYIGGVRPDRGSFTVVEALALLARRGRDVRWVCVGPVEEAHREELQRKAAAAGLSDVVFTGYLPPWEGLSRMARCHVGLALVHPTPNYVGSYPTKLFEYMALGLPVVASDTLLCREVVDDARCGFTVEPDDPEALAAALETLLADPEGAERLGRRGREAVRKRYNWSVEEEKLLAFYERLLTDRETARAVAARREKTGD